MGIISKIKSDPRLKKLALSMLIPKNEYRPRLWVKLLVNPFFHVKGKGSIIRSRTRTDLFPFNKFVIGRNSVIEDFSTINNGVGDVIVGNDTIIGLSNVIIGPVTIGNDVMFAQNVVISGLNHNYEDISLPPSKQGVTCKPIVVSDAVWIGANCVITAGVTIGKHCIIGAGSIVTKDIPDYSIVVGNPGRIIKKYNTNNKTWEQV